MSYYGNDINLLDSKKLININRNRYKPKQKHVRDLSDKELNKLILKIDEENQRCYQYYYEDDSWHNQDYYDELDNLLLEKLRRKTIKELLKTK